MVLDCRPVCVDSVIAVVVTHNRPEELRAVIGALLSQTVLPVRVLVVDNASPLPAAEVLVDFKGVDIVRSEVNSGGAGGFALALSEALKAGSDWVWMMDDDAVPRLGALEALLNAAISLPARAGVLCSAVYEFGALAVMHRRLFDHTFALERCIPASDYTSCREIDTGSFVGFMVRTAAVRQAGLPDARFFLAYDDTEFSLRLKSQGWSIWLVPASVIDHLRGTRSRLRGSVFGDKHFYNIRNRLYVARHYSRFGVFSATMMGVLIWLSSRSPFDWSVACHFRRAVIDGYRGQLGKIDE